MADMAFGVTISAIVSASSPAGSATVVAPFVRRATPPAGRVVARWDDGQPAATEMPLGAGCMRSVAVTVPSAGDLALTPSFRRFAAQLVGPCIGGRAWVAAPDSVVSTILPAVGARDAAQTLSAGDSAQPDSSIVSWLLGAAIAALAAELFVRRGAAHAAACPRAANPPRSCGDDRDARGARRRSDQPDHGRVPDGDVPPDRVRHCFGGVAGCWPGRSARKKKEPTKRTATSTMTVRRIGARIFFSQGSLLGGES